jgi:TonB family protein
MTVPQRSRREPDSRRGEGREGWRNLPPVALALAAAALAVFVVAGLALALLMFRGSRGGQQEVVGSALPPGWQPGGGQGVGQAPPAPPSGDEARAVGTVAPVPEATPYPAPPGGPGEEEESPVESTDPSSLGEPTLPTPAGEVEPSFEPPRLVYLPTPEYPAMGRRMGREGVVQLQVLVDENGHVRAADPVGERLGMGFEAAARRAAFGARFEPARSDGRRIEAETRIAIRFVLR